VLPPPLTPPLPTRGPPRTRRPIPWLALLGFALLLVAIVGAVAWVGAFSPYGFVRFSLLRATDRTITVSRPGDYLIFEEGADASQGDVPPRLAVTVLDTRGRSVPVETLIAPGTTAAPLSYHVPPNEGRAIARFSAARSGSYLLQVQPLDPRSIDPSDYQSQLPSSLAVGRQLEFAWLRTPFGLLVLAGAPLAAGVVVLVVVVRRRRRSDAAARPTERPVETVR
jgi:hypothetical protein